MCTYLFSFHHIGCKGFFIKRRVSKPSLLYAIFIKLLVFVYGSLPIGGRELSGLGSLLKGFSGIARKDLLQSARKSRNLGKNLALQAEIGSLSCLKYDNHSFVSLKSRRFWHQHAGLERQCALSGKPHSASFFACLQSRKMSLGACLNFHRRSQKFS